MPLDDIDDWTWKAEKKEKKKKGSKGGATKGHNKQVEELNKEYYD